MLDFWEIEVRSTRMWEGKKQGHTGLKAVVFALPPYAVI
jgi:hypothetical protein